MSSELFVEFWYMRDGRPQDHTLFGERKKWQQCCTLCSTN